LYGQRVGFEVDTTRVPSALRALFAQIIAFFAGTYAEVFSITEGPPLHDPLAVAAAIYPEIQRSLRRRKAKAAAGYHEALISTSFGV
jgi:inosine-uridine nucleoside N-ribohydrolase